MTHENHELNCEVLFEIPTCTNVEILSARLRPRWAGWTRLEGDVWLVAAELADDGTDVVALLREVDGRFHIMEAPPALEHAA